MNRSLDKSHLTFYQFEVDIIRSAIIAEFAKTVKEQRAAGREFTPHQWQRCHDLAALVARFVGMLEESR